MEIKANSRKVDADSVQHSNVREAGAEWICYNPNSGYYIASLSHLPPLCDKNSQIYPHFVS